MLTPNGLQMKTWTDSDNKTTFELFWTFFEVYFFFNFFELYSKYFELHNYGSDRFFAVRVTDTLDKTHTCGQAESLCSYLFMRPNIATLVLDDLALNLQQSTHSGTEMTAAIFGGQRPKVEVQGHGVMTYLWYCGKCTLTTEAYSTESLRWVLSCSLICLVSRYKSKQKNVYMIVNIN